MKTKKQIKELKHLISLSRLQLVAASAITATCVGACLDPRGSSSEQQEGGAC